MLVTHIIIKHHILKHHIPELRNYSTCSDLNARSQSSQGPLSDERQESWQSIADSYFNVELNNQRANKL